MNILNLSPYALQTGGPPIIPIFRLLGPSIPIPHRWAQGLGVDPLGPPQPPGGGPPPAKTHRGGESL